MNKIQQKITVLEQKLNKALAIINNSQKEYKTLILENQSLKTILEDKEQQLHSVQNNYLSIKGKYTELTSSQEKIKTKIENMLTNLNGIENKITNKDQQTKNSPDAPDNNKPAEQETEIINLFENEDGEKIEIDLNRYDKPSI